MIRLFGTLALATGLAGCVADPYGYGFYQPVPAYAYAPAGYYGAPAYYAYAPYGYVPYGYAPYRYAPAYYAVPSFSLGIGFFGGYGGHGHGHGHGHGGHGSYSSPRAIHGHH